MPFIVRVLGKDLGLQDTFTSIDWSGREFFGVGTILALVMVGSNLINFKTPS